MRLDGVLLLNKPRGMTSHDCVMKIRRLLGTKKVGHTGTLDPDVDGVLPICIGSATKLVQFLTANEKEYVGEVTIGYATTTEDTSGEEIKRRPVLKAISKAEITAILQSMLGTQIQIPPMYSAVKVNGKKLYEYARAGLKVTRPQRDVTIFELKLLGDIHHADGLAKFKFHIRGSKGIFIRTVAVTIGEKLGYPAHMSDLTRIASGVFKLEACTTFEDIETGNFKLFTISEALADFPTVSVDNWVEKLVRNGVKLRNEQIEPAMKEGSFLIKNQNGTPLSIHEWSEARQGYVSVRGLW
ncbi:MAG: tRNA pseudouridine(55) synthase TruB [Defluviitaleaceae bacterium]|nr:tRNA pseudouridine(55) synthase TruB [Defluviitaleaceae bacterium]